jgi:hypothetical protein
VTLGPDAAPDLTGRRYLVTGSTAGLGFFASLQLAGAGAHVIMTGRNPNRLASARAAVRRQVPDASVETLLLDTSNLGSVRAAAATVRGGRACTGCCSTPDRPPAQAPRDDGRRSRDRLRDERARPLRARRRTAAAARRGRGRMVWVGSMSTTLALRPHRPELENEYTPWRAYVQSKVATTALGFEADRRLRAASVPWRASSRIRAMRSADAHGHPRNQRALRAKRFVDNLQAPITQSKEHGAWPLVRALVDPDAEGASSGAVALVAGRHARHRVEDHARRDDRGATLALRRARHRRPVAVPEGQSHAEASMIATGDAVRATPWQRLRAAVTNASRLRGWTIDANDGIIATASLLQGFAGAGAGDRLLLLAATAATIAGGLSAGGAKWAEAAAEREAEQRRRGRGGR